MPRRIAAHPADLLRQLDSAVAPVMASSAPDRRQSSDMGSVLELMLLDMTVILASNVRKHAMLTTAATAAADQDT